MQAGVKIALDDVCACACEVAARTCDGRRLDVDREQLERLRAFGQSERHRAGAAAHVDHADELVRVLGDAGREGAVRPARRGTPCAGAE